MNTYTKMKARVKDQAIEWQREFSNHHYSWSELFNWQEYFRKMGKRYGLLTEFKENGIL